MRKVLRWFNVTFLLLFVGLLLGGLRYHSKEFTTEQLWVTIALITGLVLNMVDLLLDFKIP